MAVQTTTKAEYGAGCPDEVSNGELLRLVDKLDRYTLEYSKCQSAGQNGGFIGADAGRARDMVADCEAWITDFVGTMEPDSINTSQDVPDLPEANGRLFWPVPPPPPEMVPIATINNADVRHIVRMLAAWRVEVLTSASALLSGGILTFDAKRLVAQFARFSSAIDYATTHEPSDMPDAMPETPPPGPGR